MKNFKSKVLMKEFLNENDISTYIDKAAHDVVECLVGRGLTITTAESCTGGLLSSAITSVSGASKVFGFGSVTYSDNAKSGILGVSQSLINKCGAVSGVVALSMAKAAAKLSGADIAVAVTGIAGPEGGSEEKPVGTVFVTILYGNDSLTNNLKLYELGRLDREQNRLLTVAYALEAVLELMKG